MSRLRELVSAAWRRICWFFVDPKFDAEMSAHDDREARK